MGQAIAVVTASYNEPHKLRSWRENYETYAHDVALHIIVDDGSEPEYLDQVRRTFPASTILAHAQNRGLVAAYNTGFQFALQAGAAYIGPVAPDMRLMTDCLPRLRNALRADSTIGVVGPVWLQRGTQNTVEEIGGELLKDRASVRKYGVGSTWTPGWHGVDYVSFVCGGLHLVPREVFEVVGLQDEQLFMYCDEIDFDWRVQNAGYRLAIARDAAAWHEHIDVAGRRPPWTIYLWSRNRMLVMRKLGRRRDYIRMISGRLAMLLPAMVGWTRREGWPYAQAHVRGIVDGIRGVGGAPARLH